MTSIAVKTAVKRALSFISPQLDRLWKRQDALRAQISELNQQLANEQLEAAAERQRLIDAYPERASYVDQLASVLQYRRAYFEVHGSVAPWPAVPNAQAWPAPDGGLSYADKLKNLLPISEGKGAEIGPLNIPIVAKDVSNVLYVDHLDTDGLKKKYTTVPGIVDIDRPMVNNSLADTLRPDAPIDYVIASQVMEHVPNPIRWMKEISTVLPVGGKLAISLPDRRMTFDLYREETRASDMAAAYFADLTIPDVRAVYDHHALASAVNMHWAIPGSKTPEEVIASHGAVSARKATEDHIGMARMALGGEYLDTHVWVLTPTSFLLAMAQLAADGLLAFRCAQFYPTRSDSGDRSNHSFITILEKVADDYPKDEIRRSFLMPLG